MDGLTDGWTERERYPKACRVHPEGHETGIRFWPMSIGLLLICIVRLFGLTAGLCWSAYWMTFQAVTLKLPFSVLTLSSGRLLYRSSCSSQIEMTNNKMQRRKYLLLFLTISSAEIGHRIDFYHGFGLSIGLVKP